MHKVFPHIKNITAPASGDPMEDRPEAVILEVPVKERPKHRSEASATLPTVDPVAESRWFRLGRSIRAVRRSLWSRCKKAMLKGEFRYRKQLRRLGAKTAIISATLISGLIAAIFYLTADQSGGWKASETHLAAAQIIGAALALVLSLSIIPAQRAAELFSIAILKLFGTDRALIAVFLVLVATTMLSLLLGSSWLSWLDPKLSLSIQFILLGISFDALRRFYLEALDMLAPETAIKRVLKECDKELRLVRRTAEKLVEIHRITAGHFSDGDRLLHASVITGSHLPKTLQYWSAQLEEFAHRFIARRDSNATIEVLDALVGIAFRYAELRKESVTLHIDSQFLFAGALSDISDVLNPIYENVLHIIDDAVAGKNERVVQNSIVAMGRMTVHSMSVAATGVGGHKTAPLAYGASFYFDRAIRSALAASMTDAVLVAIASLRSILLSRVPEVDVAAMAAEAKETLFAIAVDGYVKSNSVSVFQSVGVMLAAIQFEIEKRSF
jgi:hypothetical protein